MHSERCVRPGLYLLQVIFWFIAAVLSQAAANDLRHPEAPLVQPSQTAAHLSGYRLLRQTLFRYLWIRDRGGWPQLPPQGPVLKMGDVGDEVSRIRRQLKVVGDLSEDTPESEMFDSDMERAVRHFQYRHGLEQDGIVGRKTRAALAVPVEQRILQLTINLERWRGLPRDLGGRYIMVNSAAFLLQAHAGDRVPLEMRVIVGRKNLQTPTFSESMRYLIVNPYWHVPNKIARVDLIPALLRDPGYFSSHHIRVLSSWREDAMELDPLSVRWSEYLSRRAIPFQLRQDPGPHNALGRIKFMLPNRYSVYLHDTPSKQLFKHTVRTFSHGCVRVEKPLELANYVLGGGVDGRTPSALESIIQQGKTRTILLPRPVPVYVVYMTAWVDPRGKVHFQRDIYQRDQRLAARMRPDAPASAPGAGVIKASFASTETGEISR